MKSIAYLINQYPSPSQTFIRREIAALEAHGASVRRYAVRAWGKELVDPDDRAEFDRTHRILDVGALGLLMALLRSVLSRPSSFLGALRKAVALGRVSSRGVPVHLIYLAEACQLLAWCHRDGIDHIHAHFGTNSTAVAMLCRLLGGPSYSFTVHGPEEFDSPIALSLGEKIRHAEFVVAISSYGRSQLWRWADPADWAKVEVIHCGLDPSYIDGPSPEPPLGHRFVNVGRLVEQKGQLLLVEAAARLRDQGREFEVVLIGDGELRETLVHRIRELKLESHVQLAGLKSGPEVRSAVLSSRAFVLPSFAEGLPVVLMEALALERPVITTYVAGIPELVRPNECGWLVPAGDPDELARAMAEALDTPTEQLTLMGRAGAFRVRERHDVRREARKLIDRIQRPA